MHLWTLFKRSAYAAPVVFEVYTVAPCSSIRLHASLNFILKGVHAIPVVFEVYTVAPCISRLGLPKLFHSRPLLIFKNFPRPFTAKI